MSQINPDIGPDNVRTMIKCGGATLVDLMRKAMSNKTLAKEAFTEWECEFLTDVAEKAKKFRDNLTPKQAAKAKDILLKDDAVELLVLLMEEEANSFISEPAKSPTPTAPAVNPYADDPLWGSF